MIHLKSDSDIDSMRPAGELAFELLKQVESIIKPGISTEEINTFVHDYTESKGGICAPLGYKGFPKSVCVSPNQVVCHGIPSHEVILNQGDIVNVDVTPILGGMHGDSSRTFLVGEGHPGKITDLVKSTEKAMYLGIEAVKPGARLGDIGYAIQRYAESRGFSVVRTFVGHGIGRNFHEDPMVYHYGKKGKGTPLSPGMTFTIEPMLNTGSHGCYILDDNWTAMTDDGGWSAQFEHTLAIRSDWRVEILTLPSSHPDQPQQNL